MGESDHRVFVPRALAPRMLRIVLFAALALLAWWAVSAVSAPSAQAREHPPGPISALLHQATDAVRDTTSGVGTTLDTAGGALASVVREPEKVVSQVVSDVEKTAPILRPVTGRVARVVDAVAPVTRSVTAPVADIVERTTRDLGSTVADAGDRVAAVVDRATAPVGGAVDEVVHGVVDGVAAVPALPGRPSQPTDDGGAGVGPRPDRPVTERPVTDVPRVHVPVLPRLEPVGAGLPREPVPALAVGGPASPTRSDPAERPVAGSSASTPGPVTPLRPAPAVPAGTSGAAVSAAGSVGGHGPDLPAGVIPAGLLAALAALALVRAAREFANLERPFLPAVAPD